jgi:prepilin-type N-terminal cleavage/methylation domain-containing protein
MSFVSSKPRVGGGPGRAFTFLEILIALAIAAAFLSGVYAVFIQISKARAASEARMDAVRNGRAAISTMADDLKSSNQLAGNYLFLGTHHNLSYGDGIDNDGDGQIDEEIVDGILNDAANPFNASRDDRHAQIGSFRERPLFVDKPDLGDAGVDVDAVFGRDELTFRIYPQTPTPSLPFKTITFSVEDFEGQPNVLVRRSVIERSPDPPIIAEAPLAFGVLGLDLLYWNPNASPDSQGWAATWDSNQLTGQGPFVIPLPAAVYIRLTLSADTRPIQALDPGRPVETMILETTVDIEQVIHSALYQRPVL